MFIVTIAMVTRVTASHDDTDSGMMELSKEADQLFSAIQVVTIVTNNVRADVRYSWVKFNDHFVEINYY